MDRWYGKIAVVTGASTGIGLATAKQLVRHGLTVIGLARRVNVMEEQMKDVKGPGQFHAIACDITNEKNVINVFSWIKSTFKTLHILVNNAGVVTVKKIEDSSTEELENIFKVNVFGILYCTKQAIPLMKENQTEGHIMNINSVLGHNVKAIPKLELSVYPASKFAVTALSETLKRELSDSKIRVTSISPGAVKTDMFDSIIKNTPELATLDHYPMLDSEDVSNAIVYALSVPPYVEINEITLQTKRM